MQNIAWYRYCCSFLPFNRIWLHFVIFYCVYLIVFYRILSYYTTYFSLTCFISLYFISFYFILFHLILIYLTPERHWWEWMQNKWHSSSILLSILLHVRTSTCTFIINIFTYFHHLLSPLSLSCNLLLISCNLLAMHFTSSELELEIHHSH